MRVAYFVLILLTMVVLASASPALAQGPPCSLDRLAGDWGFLNTGQIGGLDVNGTGTYRLNKDGTSSSHLFVNRGSSYLDFKRFGTTTVDSECMLTQTWNDGGSPAHCVVIDDGNQMWCIYEGTPASHVTLKRIHSRN